MGVAPEFKSRRSHVFLLGGERCGGPNRIAAMQVSHNLAMLNDRLAEERDSNGAHEGIFRSLLGGAF